MKRIAATFLALTLIAVCLPTDAAARTPPKKEEDIAEEPTTLSELPLSFAFDTIPAGRAICIGRIEITPQTVYQMDAVAKNDRDDLFVALNLYDNSTVYQRTLETEWGWHQHYGSGGMPIHALFHEIDWESTPKPSDRWYVYVGSRGGELRNVSGTLSILE